VNKGTILVVLSLSLVVGCALVDEPSAGNGGGYIVPPAPIAPGHSNIVDGYGNPAPELQQQPSSEMPMQSNDDEELYNEPGVREVHAAASRQDCYKMLERFQKEGRKLKLKVKPTDNAELPYACIFEGADASLEYFRDRRYEKESQQSPEGDG
jgi:hypothetical protein